MASPTRGVVRLVRNMPRSLSCALLPIVLAGCSAMYSEYHPRTEIPDGPGMLSGEEGAFVLFSDRTRTDTEVATDRSKSVAALRAGVAQSGVDEYREFRAFQEFKRWKELNRDTPEYGEFHDWREWRADRPGAEHAPAVP